MRRHDLEREILFAPVFRLSQFRVRTIRRNLVKPGPTVAIAPQAQKILKGAQEDLLSEVFHFQDNVRLSLISEKPPEIREDLVVMLLDQIFKARCHFLTLDLKRYNYTRAVL
jgi:hypothetical protein